MKRFFIFALTPALFGTKPAFNQQVYRLNTSQPPSVTISLAESIHPPVGTLINPDTLGIRIGKMANFLTTLIDHYCDPAAA